MKTLSLTTEIVLPIFLLMLAGYTIRRMKLISPDACFEMNGLVFRFFLPAFIIQSIMNTDLTSINRPGIFLFIALSYTALYALLFMLVPRIERDPKKRGVMIQGIARSNYSLFGIPLVGSMFPGADLSLFSLLIVVVIPLTNTLSTIALEMNREQKPSALNLLKSTILNPLIISAAIGFALMLSPISMLAPFSTALSEIAKTASPLALILLGASIDGKRAAHHVRQLLIVVISKNIIVPLFFLATAFLIGFRGVELASVLICFASPTAVNSYAMAANMGGDKDLAAECVVFTTAFSVVSVFLFVYAFLLI